MSATEGRWEKADKGSLPQYEEGIHTRVYRLNSTKGASLAGYCSGLDTWWTDSFPTASLGEDKVQRINAKWEKDLHPPNGPLQTHSPSLLHFKFVNLARGEESTRMQGHLAIRKPS